MKAYRKILSLLLAFVMILGVLPMGSLKASAAGKVWKQVNTTDTWQPENGHKYILVQGNASKALTSNSGTIGTADVTINGNVLTANSYSNITFTFDSNYMTAQNGSIKYMLSPIYGWA